MARKPRDYSAEYRRRNELAKQKGYSTYNQVRYGLKKGTLKRTEDRRIVATSSSKKYEKGYIHAYRRAGYDSPEEYMKAKSEVKAWLKKYPGPGRSKLTPDEMKNPEFIKAYHDAFIKKPRVPGALQHFLVDVSHRVTKKEWKNQYAVRWSNKKSSKK